MSVCLFVCLCHQVPGEKRRSQGSKKLGDFLGFPKSWVVKFFGIFALFGQSPAYLWDFSSYYDPLPPPPWGVLTTLIITLQL